MNRIGILLIVILFGAITLAGAIVYLRGDVFIKFAIENYVPSFCQCQIHLDKIKWKVSDPLKFKVTNLSVAKSSVTLKLNNLNFVITPALLLDRQDWKVKAQIAIDQGIVDYDSSMNTTEPVSSAESSSRKSSREISRTLNDFKRYAAALDIANFLIRAKVNKNHAYVAQIKKFTTQFDGTNQILEWNLDGVVTPPKLVFGQMIPVMTKGKILRNPESFELENTVLKLMGIPLNLTGAMAIQSNAISIGAKINKLDLATIKVEMVNAPVANWSGSIDLDAKLERAGSLAPWVANGKVSLAGFAGNISVTEDNFALSGPLRANLDADAKYSPDNGVEVSNAQWQVDLTDAGVKISSFLTKAPKVKLTSQGQAKYSKGLSLKEAEVQLSNLDVLVDGQVDQSNLADLSFQIKPLNLSGMETLFPPFSQFPLSGQVELSGRYSGDLVNPEKATLDLEKLLLDNVRGKVDWKSDSMLLAGPFAINVKGALSVVGKNVRKGDLDLNLDLTGMEIRKGDLFYKPSLSLFDIGLNANQEMGGLKVKRGYIKGPFGTLGIEGLLPVPPVYSMDLKLSTQQINFATLKPWLPSYASLIPDGQVKGSFTSKGELSPSDVLNSRLLSKGDLKIWVPSFSLKSNEGKISSSQTAAEAELPEPILPSTKLLQAMELSTEISVGVVQWKTIFLNDIRLAAKTQDGVARGQASIGKFLEGKIEFPAFEIALFDVNPSVSFKVKADKISMGKGIELFLPPWKDLISGTFSGEFKGLTKLPSSPTFLEDLHSSGRFTLAPASLKTLPIKQYLEQKMKSIAVGNGIFNRFSMQDANLAIKSDFSLSKQQLSIKPILIVTPEGHELNLSGQIGFDKNVELQGHLAVANLVRGGSFYEANKDNDGRLVVPINIGGNIMQPDIKILQEAFTEMAEKAFHYEKNRVISSVKQEAEQKIKNAGDDLKKKLREQAEKGLKDLFKK